jgi:hypothetical protein
MGRPPIGTIAMTSTERARRRRARLAKREHPDMPDNEDDLRQPSKASKALRDRFRNAIAVDPELDLEDIRTAIIQLQWDVEATVNRATVQMRRRP